MLNSRKRRVGLGVCGAAALLVATLLAATPIAAHELSEASATLVVRDGGYVQLRLQIPWADVLHTAWMPGRPMQEFLVVATSKSRSDFAKQFATVEQTIQRGTRLVADASAPVAFGRWQGATADEVYDALKRELMSRLADGVRFEHSSRLSVTAEVTTGHEIAAVRLQLPASFGPSLLTVYRPDERWVKSGELSAPVNVARRSTSSAARTP
jgi:hypothetical protein